jgi:hypothetical protein
MPGNVTAAVLGCSVLRRRATAAMPTTTIGILPVPA